MRRLGGLILALAIGITLVSCGNNDVEKDKVIFSNTESNSVKTEEVKDEVKKSLSVEELNNQLNSQPMIVTRTEYVVQDAEYKALYPDALNVIFQNNSGTDSKNVIIGFVAWDSNNFPVKIVGTYDYNGGDYYIAVEYSDVNMINGASYGEGTGFMLADKKNNISKFKAIVVSYTDFDGNTWNNPLLDDFKDLYVDKKLVE